MYWFSAEVVGSQTLCIISTLTKPRAPTVFDASSTKNNTDCETIVFIYRVLLAMQRESERCSLVKILWREPKLIFFVLKPSGQLIKSRKLDKTPAYIGESFYARRLSDVPIRQSFLSSLVWVINPRYMCSVPDSWYLYIRTIRLSCYLLLNSQENFWKKGRLSFSFTATFTWVEIVICISFHIILSLGYPLRDKAINDCEAVRRLQRVWFLRDIL